MLEITLFNNPSILQYNDLIYLLNSRQAMGKDNHRAILTEGFECLLN